MAKMFFVAKIVFTNYRDVLLQRVWALLPPLWSRITSSLPSSSLLGRMLQLQSLLQTILLLDVCIGPFKNCPHDIFWYQWMTNIVRHILRYIAWFFWSKGNLKQKLYSIKTTVISILFKTRQRNQMCFHGEGKLSKKGF